MLRGILRCAIAGDSDETKHLAMSEKEESKEIARLQKEMLRDELKKLHESVLISPL